ncbi:MAG: hypothetical protein NZ870_02595 [bacterium]|nr:hypothetical protein [bacterium]
MRKLEEKVALFRKNKILDFIVKNYLNNRVVSSSDISKELDVNLSAQSIRLIIEELEKEGYLYSNYISEKKLPTNKALHRYIDSIKNFRVNFKLNIKTKKIDFFLEYISQIISKLSNSLGLSVALAPKMVKVDSIRILNAKDISVVVFILSSGFIYERIINSSIPEWAEDYLNEKLKEHGNYIDEEYIEAVKDYTWTKDIFRVDVVSGVYAPYEYIKIKESLNKRSFLNAFLRKELTTTDEVCVKICQENEVEELKDYSVVYTTFISSNGISFGCSCVIGKRNMDYKKAIGAVNEAKEWILRSLYG